MGFRTVEIFLSIQCQKVASNDPPLLASLPDSGLGSRILISHAYLV